MVTVAFNAPFDGYLLRHRFGISPAFWMDPRAMARHALPGRTSHSLDPLSTDLGLTPKGGELKELEAIRNPGPAELEKLQEALAR